MELGKVDYLQFSPGDQWGLGREASALRMGSYWGLCLIGPDLSGRAGNPYTGAGLGEWADLALWSQGSLWYLKAGRMVRRVLGIPYTVLTAVGLPRVLSPL